jgi:hypothetical protein
MQKLLEPILSEGKGMNLIGFNAKDSADFSENSAVR